MGKKTSAVHEYFEHMGTEYSVCKLCGNKSKGIHASNLGVHLKHKHKDIFQKVTEKNKTLMRKKKSTEEEPPADTSAVWSFFEREPGRSARCILCQRKFSQNPGDLKRHLEEEHRKVTEGEAEDDRDEGDRDEEDTNCYTEVVYLEDDEQNVFRIEPKRRTTLSAEVKKGKVRCDSDDADEELETFGRYVTSLLKSLPKDLCMKLQMDMINMIMRAKLNKMADGVTSSVSNATYLVTIPGDSSKVTFNKDPL